jgi:hypothetical protein
MEGTQTGTRFENRCYDLLKTHGCSYEKRRVYHTPQKWYEPDAITDKYVFEFKYQQVGGSVNKKLTQALFELDWLSTELNLTPALVYEGTYLTKFIESDTAFLNAKKLLPNIQLLDFPSFNDLISTSTNINNREQNRLLEYA